MHETLRKLGVVTAVLLTLTYTAAAVVGGPDPGQGEMAITGHSPPEQANTSSLLRQHVTEWDLDVTFGASASSSASATEGAPSGDVASSPCLDDVREAQKAAQGQACTQQTMKLQCPHDEALVYQAPNGCVISTLQAQNWTRAPNATVNFSPDPLQTNTTHSYFAELRASFSFRSGGYHVNVSKDVVDGTARFDINILPPDGAATSVIDTQRVTASVESDTKIADAVVTVSVDGEEAYRTTFPKDRPDIGRPPVKPPARGLAHRVDQLQRQVELLQRQVQALQDLLIQIEPGMEDTIRETVPNASSIDGTDGSSVVNRTTGPGGDTDRTGQQERGPPSDTLGRGIIDAITSFFP